MHQHKLTTHLEMPDYTSHIDRPLWELKPKGDDCGSLPANIPFALAIRVKCTTGLSFKGKL